MGILPQEVQKRLLTLDPTLLRGTEELRLRVGQPLELCGQHGSCFLHKKDGITQHAADGFITTHDVLTQTVQNVSQHSLYAVEEELRRGFITIPGGHRVGVAGRVVVDGRSQVKSIRAISSLNIRIARAFPGVANNLRPYLYRKTDGQPQNVLILSPPQCGKTTLLRDIARQWSENLLTRRDLPVKVAIVDERSEIAGAVEGIPQFVVGPRTDVLDACPKAEGMLMAIRSLSPNVIVTDEIGREDDAVAIMEATHAGVAVITSAHALSIEDWRKRPHMDALFAARAFSRYVILSRRRGPGTIEAILDEGGRALL